MVRGFTLLELIIALLIVTTLVAGAGANISPLFQRQQMKETATELTGFFFQARSEAVMRNRDLFIHITESESENDSWALALGEQESMEAVPILTTSGDRIFLAANISNFLAGDEQLAIRLDRVNGNPVGNGNFEFSHKSSPEKRLRFIYFGITGRIKICSVEEDHYGYPLC